MALLVAQSPEYDVLGASSTTSDLHVCQTPVLATVNDPSLKRFVDGRITGSGMRVGLRTTTTYLAILLCASSGTANVFTVAGVDPRVSIDLADPASRQLRPIGYMRNKVPISLVNRKTKVFKSGLGTSTLFMISPCYAMTNHHAVFGSDYDPSPADNHSVEAFFAGSVEGTGAFKAVGKPVKWADIAHSPGQDWAIVKLSPCVGEIVGWLEMSPTTNPRGNVEKIVSTAGYPRDRPGNSLTLERGCRLRDYKPGTGEYLTDCSIRPGASGGPIWTTVDGSIIVIGIHSAELDAQIEPLNTRYDARYASFAVAFYFLEMFPEIMKVMTADAKRFGRPNPAM